MRKKLLAVFALLTLAVAACELPFSASTLEDGILFRDDFSDVDSGWDRSKFESGLTDYERGGYRIFVTETDYSAWANPSRNFSDVRVEVEAKKLGGMTTTNLASFAGMPTWTIITWLRSAVTVSTASFYARMGKVWKC